jgi:ADP-heptose:LPS heptosyltransferase
MSNILIIKHGSLGDIVQISGVLQDIRENNINHKIYILTTKPYYEVLSKCPHIDGVLIDERLPRWNIIYLIKLNNMLKKFNFSHVYDLQNSSRTSFYKNFLLKKEEWSSTDTTLKKGEKKKDFDEESVLDRFKIQLENSNIKTKHCLKPDFSWSQVNVDNIIKRYLNKNFILIFPFCSPQLSHKKWPYFNELIKIIKHNHKNFEFVVAPGPNELNDASKIQAISITNNKKSLSITELSGLILKSSYVISNDTGPAHMTAHLGKPGVAIFGHHTTPKKVSIETKLFKALSVKNLKNLYADKVYSEIQENFN